MCVYGIWWLGHGLQELYLHISSAQEVVIGALLEHRGLQKQRGSVGAGGCAESGSNLDLILQLLMVASPIFVTYKTEARTQQEKAQDFLLGRMLYGASGSQVLCIAYFMVLLE